MSDNFFSRWSRRKQDAAAGATFPEPDLPVRAQNAPESKLAPASKAVPVPVSAQPSTPEPATPLPTMDDVHALTPASDFQSFMRQGVPGEVRNAAMKKLFTDPHFNVMDGLDIYIGDYTQADPLPPGMLEKMVGAELLNLFPKKPLEIPAETAEHSATEKAFPSPAAPEDSTLVAQSPQSQTTQALPLTPELPAKELLEHDYPDLQLQPNHTPASPDSGQSTG